MNHHASFSSWWGRHAIEANRMGMWQIGPLYLWIKHLAHQWSIHWNHGPDWLDSRVLSRIGIQNEAPAPGTQEVSCVLSDNSREELIFSPTLADRPLIAQLPSPLFVVPGETIFLYVVSPLWLRLELAQPAKLLHELPIFRLSDTWFGPTSNLGELCYSIKGSTFLDLREVPLRLHCVITTVKIRNSGSDSLRLDRINVPLPQLSLFYSPRTGFWTDMVSLERREDNEMASLKLDRQPPPDASPTQFVAGPRRPSSESHGVIRAFSTLFRERSQA